MANFKTWQKPRSWNLWKKVLLWSLQWKHEKNESPMCLTLWFIIFRTLVTDAPKVLSLEQFRWVPQMGVRGHSAMARARTTRPISLDFGNDPLGNETVSNLRVFPFLVILVWRSMKKPSCFTMVHFCQGRTPSWWCTGPMQPYEALRTATSQPNSLFFGTTGVDPSSAVQDHGPLDLELRWRCPDRSWTSGSSTWSGQRVSWAAPLGRDVKTKGLEATCWKGSDGKRLRISSCPMELGHWLVEVWFKGQRHGSRPCFAPVVMEFACSALMVFDGFHEHVSFLCLGICWIILFLTK